MVILYRDSATRDVVWWTLARQGKSAREIGREFGLSHTTIRKGITREEARRRLPKFEILMPLLLKPDSSCPHGIISDGQTVYCIQCHATGLDGHPDLVIDKAVERFGALDVLSVQPC